MKSSQSAPEQLQSDRFAGVGVFPFGVIGVRTKQGLVAEICYLPDSFKESAPKDLLAADVLRQIASYVDNPAFTFELPLALEGSAFQRRVWRAISQIPAGDLVTYGALATQLGTAARAVGNACGSNWFPLVIPCHRVVGTDNIGGFAGTALARLGAGPEPYTASIKRWLLRHENACLPGAQGRLLD